LIQAWLTKRGEKVGRITLARTFFQRMRGYMFRTGSCSPDGLLFERCRGVHMWFVFMPLDVFLFAKDGQFLKAKRAWPFWSFVWHPQAYYVLELIPGRLPISLSEGEAVAWLSYRDS